jgi:glycerol-3-phosphate dehydrogenase (NAD(P)+)
MNVGVVGKGLWGQALAKLARTSGSDVKLGGRTDDLRLVSEHARLIFIATPSPSLRDVLSGLSLGPQHRVVLATRGLDPQGGGWLSDVVLARSAAIRVGAVAGPALPADVQADLPCALVVASLYDEVCHDVQNVLHSPMLRVYRTNDLHGIQLAGAMVPVLAAAVGLADGAGFGAAARGLIVARGLAEARRLARALGADPATLHGLAGLGDLASALSRDDHPAIELGRGLARGELHPEAETFQTAAAAVEQAQRLGVELPLAAAVLGVATGELLVSEAIKDLMTRALKGRED